MDIQNKRIPDSEFHALRAEVLTQWPTGKDVNLEEAVAYHKAMPENRIFGQKLLNAKKTKTTLVLGTDAAPFDLFRMNVGELQQKAPAKSAAK